jgi:hypothetical protein
MAAHEHVSMKTGMSGDTAAPTATGRCARRESAQQCAVARFGVWAATPWRTVGARAIEGKVLLRFATTKGCTWAAATAPLIGNCCPQGGTAEVT